MQRVLATLLLALFSYPLILPAILVDSDAKLPACCRREGKHHCGMANTESRQSSGAAVREKCPSYPGVSAFPAFSNTLVLNAAQVFYESLAKHPAVHSQTQALLRISFSWSSQKRGPPSFLS